MGIPKAYDPAKGCQHVQDVNPKTDGKIGKCHIDGSAVSYTRFKSTEGRLLLKQMKKDAKTDTSLGLVVTSKPPSLVQWNGSSWFIPVSTTNNTLLVRNTSTAATTMTTTIATVNDTASTGTSQGTPDISLSPSLTGSPSSSASPHQLSNALDLYPELNKARQQILPQLARSMDRMYDNVYKKCEDVIHYDGPATMQKRFAHEQRAKASKSKRERLSGLIKTAEARLAALENKVQLSNRQLARLKAFLNSRLFPLWTEERGVDTRTTSAVAKLLRETHGWQTHICDGQFDVCAGKMAHLDKNLTVVSTDSDLMFMRVGTLIRFQAKGSQFHSYPIKKVYKHAGLKTEEEWIAAAILTRNDYDPSAGHQSFENVIKAIIKIRGRRKQDRSVLGFVTTYCQDRGKDISVVQNSIDSFVGLKEDLDNSYRPGNDKLDESIRQIVYRVEVLTRR
jgi:hypothetical protein